MVGTCWQAHGVRHHPMEISVIIQKPSAWGDWAIAKNLAWDKVQNFTGLWMQRWSCWVSKQQNVGSAVFTLLTLWGIPTTLDNFQIWALMQHGDSQVDVRLLKYIKTKRAFVLGYPQTLTSSLTKCGPYVLRLKHGVYMSTGSSRKYLEILLMGIPTGGWPPPMGNHRPPQDVATRTWSRSPWLRRQVHPWGFYDPWLLRQMIHHNSMV